MIDSLITLLIMGILIASLVQENGKDAFVATVFALGIWLHEVLFSHLNSAYYFTSAGMLDAIVIFIIIRVRSRLSLPLSILAFISLITNLVGLYFWWNYYEPLTYNALMLGIYCLSFYILVGGRYGANRIYRELVNSISFIVKSLLFYSNKSAKK